MNSEVGGNAGGSSEATWVLDWPKAKLKWEGFQGMRVKLRKLGHYITRLFLNCQSTIHSSRAIYCTALFCVDMFRWRRIFCSSRSEPCVLIHFCGLILKVLDVFTVFSLYAYSTLTLLNINVSSFRMDTIPTMLDIWMILVGVLPKPKAQCL